MIDADDWAAAETLLRQHHRLLLLTHHKPDADTIGSALGLGHALETLGKEVAVVCADPVTEAMATLPGADRVLAAVPDDREWDAIVTLDASTLERLGAVYAAAPERFERVPVLNVDHHLTNPRFGSANLVDAGAAATAEVVVELLERMAIPLTAPAATCLMAGLITDTLSFQTEGTTPQTLRTAATLLTAGAPLNALADRFFRRRALASALVWRGALGTLRFAAGGRIASVEISRAVLQSAGPGAEGAGLSGFAASIQGVEVGFSLEESEAGPIFVSLRSPTVDVAAVAATFGGGGHARAAGLQFPPPETLASARDRLVEAIEATLLQL